MKKHFKLIVLSIIITCFIVAPVYGQEYGTGLEVEEPEIQVFIANLSDDAKDIGLSKELVRSKVELALRRNGITVIDPFRIHDIEENEVKTLDHILSVEILVVGNAFSFYINFFRTVRYQSSDKDYITRAAVWTRSATGTHGYSSSYIIESLEDYLDIFINEFFRANDFG